MGRSVELCLFPKVFMFEPPLIFPAQTPPQISAHLHRDHKLRKDIHSFKNPIISNFFSYYFPLWSNSTIMGCLEKKQQQIYLPNVQSNKPMEGSL